MYLSSFTNDNSYRAQTEYWAHLIARRGINLCADDHLIGFQRNVPELIFRPGFSQFHILVTSYNVASPRWWKSQKRKIMINFNTLGSIGGDASQSNMHNKKNMQKVAYFQQMGCMEKWWDEYDVWSRTRCTGNAASSPIQSQMKAYLSQKRHKLFHVYNSECSAAEFGRSAIQ